MGQALQKNETVRLQITGISSDGNGVGRYNGMAVFVPMTAIGDELDVKIVKVQKTHAFAIIERIIKPSDDRIENDCAAYRRCGGCSLRHIHYTRELAIKANWVCESLRRIGGVDLDQIAVDAPLASPNAGRYRNKAQYPVRLVDGRIRAGFFAKRSHALIPLQDCGLQPVEFSDIVQAVVEFMEENAIEPYDEETGEGIVRHIFIRQAEAHGCKDELISGIGIAHCTEQGAKRMRLQAAAEAHGCKDELISGIGIAHCTEQGAKRVQLQAAAEAHGCKDELGSGIGIAHCTEQGAKRVQLQAAMLCLVINTPALPHADKLTESIKARCPKVSTIVINENRKKTNVIFGDRTTVLSGSGYITDTLCGVKVRLSAQSFYQVNRQAAELLYKSALEYAAPEKTDVLLDLYCGTGTIGLSMAHAVGEVIGVEVVPEAVADAEQNAAQNGISNARFLCADASAAAERLRAENVRPDIIVLDPPRKGADEKLFHIIAELSPRKLVYISCNPATLARDIARLAPLGYKLARVRAVDMFPRTAHIECVAEIVARK